MRIIFRLIGLAKSIRMAVTVYLINNGFSQIIRIISKANNSAKNNSKKGKIEQENIQDFAEKIHQKHLKLNE